MPFASQRPYAALRTMIASAARWLIQPRGAPHPVPARPGHPARSRRTLGAALALALPAAAPAAITAAEAAAETPARFSVRDRVVAPPVPAITATIGAFGGGGRLMSGGDFEPIVYRTWFRAGVDAPPDAPGEIRGSWREITGWDVLRDGALDGAEVSVMRLVDGGLREVRRGRIPAGGFHASGWLPMQSWDVAVAPGVTSMEAPVAAYERRGVARWYAVRAIDGRGRISDWSQPARVRTPDDPARGRKGANKNANKDRGGDLIKLDYDAGAATADPGGPGAPRGLTASVDDGGRIMLDWQPPEGDPGVADVAGYAVYESYGPPDEMQGFRIETEVPGAAADGVLDAPVRAGDLVILRRTFDDPDRARIVSDRVWAAKGANDFRPQPVRFWNDEDPRRAWHLRPHPQGQAWGGRSYLELALATGADADIGTVNSAGTEGNWYEVLRPDVPYVVSVRLRGDRPGYATFRLKGVYGKDVAPVRIAYGTDWQTATFTFTVPWLERRAQPPGSMLLTFDNPGAGPRRIDVDDFRIRPDDTPWLDLSAQDYDRLAASGVSSLRTHGLIKTGTNTYDLAMLLSANGFAHGRNQVPGLPGTLAMMARAGVAPWLQIEPHLTDDEWRGLVEYLAAPFDPATDDAAALPWAALRVAQGRDAPWADAFDLIRLEIGNETWNRLFAPWTFRPMVNAVTGEKASPGRAYGLFQSHVAEVLRSSPWWDKAGLEDKVSFVIGGHVRSNYGTQAAEAAPDAADVLTIAAYNGGWDEGEGPPDGSPASYSNVLNQVSSSTIPNTRRQVEAARKIGDARGRPLAVGTYEAGPGYALNGLNGRVVTPEETRLQERVMKGRAAGVATLDTFLAQRREGFALQNFFTFGEGTHWRSHAPWHRGGAAYPSWALLSLLDRVGGGEMLAVDTASVPVRDLAEVRRQIAVEDAPQLAVYATRQTAAAESGAATSAEPGVGTEDGVERLTVIAISRKVPGYPGAGDDGCTPLTIDLPVRGARSLTLWRTGGAWDATGADGDPPPIEEVALDPASLDGGTLRVGPATGAPECGLPPASAYIWMLEDPQG